MDSLVFLLSPFVIGFGLRWIIPATSDWGRAGLALLAASIPPLALIVMSQNADAISSAATLSLIPVLFLIMLIPAGLGVHISSMVRRAR